MTAALLLLESKIDSKAGSSLPRVQNLNVSGEAWSVSPKLKAIEENAGKVTNGGRLKNLLAG